METNVAKRTYIQMENMVQNMDQMKQANAAPSTGLLGPRKMGKPMKNEATLEENPAYRVAKYFQTLRNKRMELNGGKS
jgi:hypothetical protein